MLLSVRAFFEEEKRHGRSILRERVIDRTAQATNISKSTIKNILTPTKRYTASRIRINPDAFDREVIRRTVHSFYEKREYPTLTGILDKLKEDELFVGGCYCLWKVLREMGFTYKKRDKRRFVCEQPDIIEQRHIYILTNNTPTETRKQDTYIH